VAGRAGDVVAGHVGADGCDRDRFRTQRHRNIVVTVGAIGQGEHRTRSHGDPRRVAISPIDPPPEEIRYANEPSDEPRGRSLVNLRWRSKLLEPAVKGVKRELTAEDYAYTIKRYLDPKNRSPYLLSF